MTDSSDISQTSEEARRLLDVECCQAQLGAVLIARFVQLLEHEASEDGSLDLAAVRRVADAFKTRSDFAAVLPDRCLNFHRALIWDELRQNSFDRLLVKRFAHLMPKRAGDDGTDFTPVLSRCMIPGFLIAFVKMAGMDFYEKAQAITRKIVAGARKNRGGPIDWDALEKTPLVMTLVDQALLRILPYFSDFEHRLTWLVEVVNSNLAPAAKKDSPLPWTMNRERALALVEALFDNLLEQLRNEPQILRENTSREAFDALIALSRSLTLALASSSTSVSLPLFSPQPVPAA